MIKKMKKFMVLILVFFGMICLIGVYKAQASSSGKYVRISKTNFPDDCFRKYIKKYDKNKDNRFSAKEIKAVTSLNLCSDDAEDPEVVGELLNIKSVTGVEYFTNLKKFKMYNSSVRSMTINSPELESFLMMGHLEKLNLNKSENKLKKLSLSGYYGMEMDLGRFKNLEVVEYGNNGSSAIEYDKLNLEKCKKLKKLNLVNDARATVLDLTMFPNLADVTFIGRAKKIDVHGLKKLKTIECSSSGVKEISVKGCINLEVLNTYENPIKTLDLTTNVNLRELCCIDANISSLNCTNNSKLKRIYCDQGVKLKGVKSATVKIERWRKK